METPWLAAAELRLRSLRAEVRKSLKTWAPSMSLVYYSLVTDASGLVRYLHIPKSAPSAKAKAILYWLRALPPHAQSIKVIKARLENRRVHAVCVRVFTLGVAYSVEDVMGEADEYHDLLRDAPSARVMAKSLLTQTILMSQSTYEKGKSISPLSTLHTSCGNRRKKSS